ncbi:MAG: serine/threonine protein kinase [Planctomycetes bacterium]|nr:serine/threonine protein kinase [Planctomycetota bacterium]
MADPIPWDFKKIEAKLPELPDLHIIEQIGTGGMGSVYLAEDSTGRRVAVKTLPGFGTTPDSRIRFEREAQLLARLRHPAILTIHGYHVVEGQAYMISELVEGEHLDQAVKALDMEGRLELLDQLFEAIAFAHAAGICHRDLKPANILVAQGQLKVVDFGLSTAEDSERLTVTGGFAGTPLYAAPERISGVASRERGDVWALGAIAYEVLTGEPAYPATTYMEIAGRVNPPSATPQEHVPELPSSVSALILRALSPKADLRYRDAGEMLKALRTGRAQRRPSWALPAVGGGLALVLLLGGVGFASLAERSNGPPPQPSVSTQASVPPTPVPLPESLRLPPHWAAIEDGSQLTLRNRAVLKELLERTPFLRRLDRDANIYAALHQVRGFSRSELARPWHEERDVVATLWLGGRVGAHTLLRELAILLMSPRDPERFQAGERLAWGLMLIGDRRALARLPLLYGERGGSELGFAIMSVGRAGRAFPQGVPLRTLAVFPVDSWPSTKTAHRRVSRHLEELWRAPIPTEQSHPGRWSSRTLGLRVQRLTDQAASADPWWRLALSLASEVGGVSEARQGLGEPGEWALRKALGESESSRALALYAVAAREGSLGGVLGLLDLAHAGGLGSKGRLWTFRLACLALDGLPSLKHHAQHHAQTLDAFCRAAFAQGDARGALAASVLLASCDPALAAPHLAAASEAGIETLSQAEALRVVIELPARVLDPCEPWAK